MRILLDENLNWRLERLPPGHEVRSVPLLGWAGLKNGRRLQRAADEGFPLANSHNPNTCRRRLRELGRLGQAPAVGGP